MEIFQSHIAAIVLIILYFVVGTIVNSLTKLKHEKLVERLLWPVLVVVALLSPVVAIAAVLIVISITAFAAAYALSIEEPLEDDSAYIKKLIARTGQYLVHD